MSNYHCRVHERIGRLSISGNFNAELEYHFDKRSGYRRIELSLTQSTGGDSCSVTVENEAVVDFVLPREEGLARLFADIIDTSSRATRVPDEVRQKILDPLKKTFGI